MQRDISLPLFFFFPGQVAGVDVDVGDAPLHARLQNHFDSKLSADCNAEIWGPQAPFSGQISEEALFVMVQAAFCDSSDFSMPSKRC